MDDSKPHILETQKLTVFVCTAKFLKEEAMMLIE